MNKESADKLLSEIISTNDRAEMLCIVTYMSIVILHLASKDKEQRRELLIKFQRSVEDGMELL